jgi:hypothetical protein
MPFDPISWAAGFVLTNAAKKGLDLVFTADLRSTLEKEIEEWSKTLPAYAHPATLFSVIDTAPHDEHRPALVRVHAKILDLEIPSKEEWSAAFIEQWRAIGQHLGTQAQPFFHLDEAQALTYLIDLAGRVRAKCSQDQKFALPHIVNELDRIQVTLAELLQLQALRTIPQTGKADSQGVDRVTRTVVNLGLHKGWPNAFVAHMVTAGKLSVIIVLAESEQYVPVASLLEIDEERLAIWSSLPDSVLRQAISKALFETPLFTSVEQNWNSLVTFVGSISRTLYPNSVRNGVFGISARHDLKRIGVPFPANREPRPGDDRVVNMKLERNESLIPFLTFGQPELEQIIGVSTADASGAVARWLSGEWGPPSFITSH